MSRNTTASFRSFWSLLLFGMGLVAGWLLTRRSSRRKNAAYEARIAVIESRSRKTERDLTDARLRADQAQGTLAATTSMLNDAHARLATAAATLQQVSEERAGFAADVQSRNIEVADLKMQLAMLQDQSEKTEAGVTADAEVLRSELDMHVTQVACLTAERDDALAELAAVRASSDQITQLIAAKDAALNESYLRAIDLHRVLEDRNAILTGSQRQLADVEAEKLRLQAELGHVRGAYADTRTRLVGLLMQMEAGKAAAEAEAEAAEAKEFLHDATGTPPPLPPETPRYLNAAFFTANCDDAPLPSNLPLVLEAASYRLGVNVGDFWSLGERTAPLPDAILAPLFDRRPELALQVAVRSFTIGIPQPCQPLLLTARGNSKTVFFPLEIPDTGRHAIDVDLIVYGHLLQSRRVEAWVVERAEDAVPADGVPAQDSVITFTRTASLDPESLDALAQRPRHLTIVTGHSPIGDQIGWRFYRTSSEVEELGFVDSYGTDANLITLLRAARKQMQAAVKDYQNNAVLSLPQVTAHFGKLADIGASFYRNLLEGLADSDRTAGVLRKLLAALEPGTTVQIAPMTSQLCLPWEILYDRPHLSYKEGRTQLCPDFRAHGPDGPCPSHNKPEVVCPYGFWGYRYIIEQIPCRVERDDPPKPALPMYVRNDLPVHLTALINPALQNWETHALHLAQLAPAADLVLEQRDTFEGILTALAQAQADIFYVYTHGGRDELGRACLKVNDGDFIVTDDLDAYQVMFTDMQPLIVLNACDSARYSPQDFENLLLYFCKHGAAGVVGAQCGVSELLVDSIMAPFLTEFLRQVPAGEALYRARCLLLTGQQPDPRGLVYSLFAAADLQIAQGIADA